MIPFALKYQLAKVYSLLQPKRVIDSHVCLMYHSIYKTKEDYHDHFSVELNNFKRHMQALKSSGIDIVPFGQEPHLENSVSITFDDGFKDNLTLVAPIMQELEIPYTVFMISDFLAEEHPQYLNNDELKTLSTMPGAQVGAHGQTHRPLGKLSNEQALTELQVSKKTLEAVLEAEVTSMSFPHGSYHSDILQQALQVGFKHIGNSIALPNLNENNTSMINRIAIFEYDSAQDVLNKLAGKWDWMGKR